MKVNDKPYRSIWLNQDGWSVDIIDQTVLPHEFLVHTLKSPEDAAEAISTMRVRGAPLIGATAAYGMALAMRNKADDQSIEYASQMLLATRPTAVNLRWALSRVVDALLPLPEEERARAAYELSQHICDEDVDINFRIGGHGFRLIEGLWQEKKDRADAFHILTHCNAGWLATVDWGTALAPIYRAHDAEIPVHVWVDETRPRNQGAALTAWELAAHGVPHDLIVDNAGGHLMQHGMVDLCITGTDRTARNGDVCNKIGTYLKALAAQANGIPFYVVVPESTIDWRCASGDGIPIEERDASELLAISGVDAGGQAREVMLAGAGSRAHNPAFDITPAELVTALVTEHGIFEPSPAGMERLQNQISSSRPM